MSSVGHPVGGVACQPTVPGSTHLSVALSAVIPSNAEIQSDEHHGAWSARVGIGYRVLGFDKLKDIVWIWIGAHAEYDRLLA